MLESRADEELGCCLVIPSCRPEQVSKASYGESPRKLAERFVKSGAQLRFSTARPRPPWILMTTCSARPNPLEGPPGHFFVTFPHAFVISCARRKAV